MPRWRRVWEAFWFLPAVFCVLAVVLAEVMIAVDERVDASNLGPLANLVNRVGEAGSRDLLGAIAGSALTVAATGFSITIAVLATASSTYGPRLVRNFMADRGNQVVLGVFTGTFLYSLMVLRSIRSTGDAAAVFVPHLAVNLAVLFAALSVGVLIYFINHIADSVQVWTLAKRVRAELLDVIDERYPAEAGRRPTELDERAATATEHRILAEGIPVDSNEAGYLQYQAEKRLVTAVARHDAVVAMQVQPGDHLIDGTVLALVWPPERANEELARAVRSCLVVGQARTPQQDVRFAVQVLEEMAVRALSPGTNDPYTALNSLDEISAGLVRLAGRTMPSPYLYDSQRRVRVITRQVGLNELVDNVFDAMRTYAVEHVTVLHRTLELARQIGDASDTAAVQANLRRHIGLIAGAYERTSPQHTDLVGLQQAAREVGESLARAAPDQRDVD